MLSCRCSGSTRLRFTSTEQASFFFQPVQLHFELTDLLIELILQLRICLLAPFPTIRKGVPQVVQSLFLPLRNLRWMYLVVRGDLVDRAYSLNRFQRHLALELRAVLLPLFPHQSLPRGTDFISYSPVQFLGSTIGFR